MKKIENSKLAIIFTAILLGFLVALQARVFSAFQGTVGRDTGANIFREIQILKDTNENLLEEIENLEGQLVQFSDRALALKAIQDEITKNQILAGHTDVAGIGVEFVIKRNISVIWLTDVVNELWSAGAEAVSVNNIRLTNSTIGFDTLPNGQISLNGSLLTSPYIVHAIGDSKTLYESLTQPEGILNRLKRSIDIIGITVEEKELIKMEKVL